jgi:hypothetical protein
MDNNMTRQEYREEELRDALHERNLYDFDYYWENAVSDEERKAIETVAYILKKIAKYHDGIGFSELEEMV